MVGQDLLNIYNEVVQHISIGSKINIGIFKLIPKKGDDRELIGGWRPIILLNASYKIMSKILAFKINTSLKKIIREEQTSLNKGRIIIGNIMVVSEGQEWTHQSMQFVIF